ncbi:MAG: nuclear transport factor 2 family protein [Planctomycetota bacterium]|nr:nuclear transport factor 2 family protein [Planctomycetota bacterium]
MKRLLLLYLSLFAMTACTPKATNESPSIQREKATMQKEIESVLTVQTKAWNNGDIDAFMEHYWKSDQLTFSSGGKTTRGWQKTKDNYKKRYPNKETMGQLKFSGLEVTKLGDEAALVLGHWQLTRKDDKPGGNFSLTFRFMDGRWLIVHDHTSLLPAPK